ncbi:MAG: T9SS type A sorting domain-containing protein [Saprospiraceae bacterium]|nr:T9SS type A sorting domain-containing protein [Saprospiraceae bacterium]
MCPGGNDKVDNNHDGKPDCKYPPATQTELIAAWKCGTNNKKVLVCHKGNTLCVDYSALAGHLNHGDYIGPCGNANCVNGINSLNNQLTRSDILGNKELEITTFPNPSTNEFQLSINKVINTEKVSVKVTDVQGRQLYLQQGSSNRVFRFGSDFVAGIYVLEVSHAGEREVMKLIKN